ncbi:unnamed protein product [Tuber aestivum]|uniref:Cytochrome P450 n=1 Tax=Tuber aestivum TaxID=59557 RepID=A0A292PS40_9PEZI|nr:unnamed protein product [Tuber aestivum]
MDQATDLLSRVEHLLLKPLHHSSLQALAAFLVWYVVYQRYFHPLRKFPGPFLASLTVFWRLSNILTFRQSLNDHALHQKYGPVFRDGPNSLSIADPRALEPIYGTRNELSKTPWYLIMDPDNTGEDYSVFSSRRAEQHKRLKKRIAGAYSMTSVRVYEPVIDRNVNDLLAWMKELKTLDVSVWTHYFAMDCMSEIAYGNRMGFLINGTDVNGYRKALHESVVFIATMGYLTGLNYVIKSKWLSPYLAPSPKDKHGYGHMIGMTQALATDLLENGNTTGKRNMSHDLLQCRNDDNTPLSKKELIGEMLAFTTAGSDPTAYEISSILDRICRHGEVREKVLQELRGVGELEQSSAEGVVTYAQTLRLPYFLAVVKETMRLSPAFQGQFSRVAPEGGEGLEVLPGVVVPGGVWLSVNTYISQRDKLIFGEDAEEFKPERWLPIGGDRYHAMAKHLSVFGYGSTACMGKYLASQKINKTVVEILRRFNVELRDPKAPLKEKNIIQMFISDLFMTFTERENKI